ncbi:MAG: Holliday junction resolvase RuvX [Lachnospiraceae bacterium]|nr:Holliday junction resolvase RuvX [Lachnospiraceae bacterium]
MRIMGLDYGSLTVGVALSDELLITAQPLKIIRREKESHLRRTLAELEDIARGKDVRLIVLGLPLNMDGTAGERALLTNAFREKLERRLEIPVVFSDERLTSVESEEMMRQMGIPASKYKDYVDMLAANLILREYMENHRDVLEELKKEQTGTEHG